MQRQRFNSTRTNRKTRLTSSEAEPPSISYSTGDRRDFASAYGEGEHRQVSASQAQEYEYPFDEDDAPGWKATSYPRRKVQKGWWAMVALTAILFFLLGASVNSWIMPGMKSKLSSSQNSLASKPPLGMQQPVRQPQMWPPAHNFSFFINPIFTSIATQEVASALHLTPEQITIKIVNANYGLSAIAANQGIRYDKLYPIEQKALNDMLDAEMKAGYIRSEEATAWKNQFWDNPGKLDNVVGSMFSGYPVDISY